MEGAGLVLAFPVIYTEVPHLLPPPPIWNHASWKAGSTSGGLLRAEWMTRQEKHLRICTFFFFFVLLVFLLCPLTCVLKRKCPIYLFPSSHNKRAIVFLSVTPQCVMVPCEQEPGAHLNVLRPTDVQSLSVLAALSSRNVRRAWLARITPGVAVRFAYGSFAAQMFLRWRAPPRPLITPCLSARSSFRCRSRSTRASWRRRTPCSTSRS